MLNVELNFCTTTVKGKVHFTLNSDTNGTGENEEEAVTLNS